MCVWLDVGCVSKRHAALDIIKLADQRVAGCSLLSVVRQKPPYATGSLSGIDTDTASPEDPLRCYGHRSDVGQTSAVIAVKKERQ